MRDKYQQENVIVGSDNDEVIKKNIFVHMVSLPQSSLSGENCEK